MTSLKGIGVSPGFAAGPVYSVAPPPELPPPTAVSDVDSEVARGRAALADVSADLERRARAAGDSPAGQILNAQSMMAADPALADAVEEEIRGGADAAHAIDAAIAVHRAAFEAAGGYLAERVADLDDLRDRAVAVALGRSMPGIPSPGHPFVLVANDLSPADTAGLDPRSVVALVTAAGGPTSHTAILARGLGLPAVVRCPDILTVVDGMPVTVDGSTGEVRVGVTAEEVAESTARETARRAALAASSGPGRTADGHGVQLLANVGSAKDLAGGLGDGVEGIGLFRTELLYLDRAEEPSFDEQVEAYRAVFEAMGSRKVVVRTLDAGADKPLPFITPDDEPNPALGVRGIRIAEKRPAVLRSQLKAIAEAARTTDADVWVMAPMISTPAEGARFAEECRAAGIATAGVMIEVPAAALRSAAMLRGVDFLSIGTNDLSQYTFAADRMCGELAELLDPWQPALLELIATCAAAGKAAGRSVGVCGEAASDPGLAVVLTGLGISSLSMSPRSVPAVRESLARYTLAECAEIAKAALAAEDAAAARSVLS
ncbi:phosphoenolpyruvate-protein phosphotransferase [Virgisporangium aliadipatigenens]|uniref:Phosphoenolpyruvate-protein phosphotransferase n=1 Tax=Virgisporangium aliadipatigenens TaxID=741659 RepID=A0A8J4DR34_9ACTN|nr:phosphoenolpyruvate--protein phosphotransferase [Virgisporangium aliadipatigenens]GIJ46363.1 phosphoenolpyruvate-protein phosphotransferase [Virgisporangium aliadipatigenens]